jgi:hypothetical protein
MTVKTDEPIYTNEHYAIWVGLYPDEKLESYLVVNRQYGVVEYCHSIFHFAKSWADNFSKVMNEEKAGTPDIDALPDINRPVGHA